MWCLLNVDPLHTILHGKQLIPEWVRDTEWTLFIAEVETAGLSLVHSPYFPRTLFWDRSWDHILPLYQWLMLAKEWIVSAQVTCNHHQKVRGILYLLGHNHKENVKQSVSFRSFIRECDLGRGMTRQLKRESQYKEASLSFPPLWDTCAWS